MKARTLASILAAGLLAALPLMSGVAAAATKPVTRATPPSIDQEIVERGSNGFFVKVEVHDRRLLTLSAIKFDRGLSFETASYKMPVQLRPGSTEIEARLGKLGRVDMRFLSEKVKEVPSPDPDCKGGKIVEEEGFWVGLLAFHGESGFTQVRVRGAFGTVTKTPSLRCRQRKGPNLKKLKRELKALERQQEEEKKEAEESGETEAEERSGLLKLEATARHHRVVLSASRAAFGKGRKRSSVTNLTVVGSRHRGRIEETAAVHALFAPGSYLLPTDSRDPSAEAVLKPRAPFTGSATYRTHPHGPPTWNGDLKVALPGFGRVRLAGKGTRAAACESIVGSCLGSGSRASSLLLKRLARG